MAAAKGATSGRGFRLWLIAEFALIYGNDWFQVPLSIPVGCQASITSLNVADTFGTVVVSP